jgi:hypothetical protein
MNYKLTNDPRTVVKHNDDGSLTCFDPTDTGEKHQQEYQQWLDAGNVARPVDERTEWQKIRDKRDELIKASDWTMIPGASVDQAQWSAYRQILRDLPQTYTNAEDVVWPTVPSTSGPNTIEE